MNTKTKFEMRLMVVAVVALVVVVAIAFALAARPSFDPPGPVTLAEQSPAVLVELPQPLGPSRHGAGGVPVGWRHDQAGAEAAAAAYVESSALVAKAGPLARRDVILTLATPDYGPSLVEATNRELDDLLFALGERGLVPADLVWSEYALSVSSERTSADRCVVHVWSVLVLGAKGGSTVRQVWRTSTLELAWTDGDWKVERWATSPGPFPAPPPEADASTLAEASEVISWRRAPGGSS